MNLGKAESRPPYLQFNLMKNKIPLPPGKWNHWVEFYLMNSHEIEPRDITLYSLKEYECFKRQLKVAVKALKFYEANISEAERCNEGLIAKKALIKIKKLKRNK